MADMPVDFSSIDTSSSLDTSASLYVPIDPSLPGITADSTDPLAVAPDPGLFGSVGPEPMVSNGVATADTLSSTDGIVPTANADMYFADGSYALGLSSGDPQFFAADGSVLGATQDANGYWHLSDGTIVDPVTGNKWASDGISSPVDPSAPGSPAAGGSGGFSPIGGSRPLGGGGGSGAAVNNAGISKALGSLGAAIASIFGKPQNPTNQQLARQRATAAGLPSNLNATGSGVFVLGSLALIFLLLKGK